MMARVLMAAGFDILSSRLLGPSDSPGRSLTGRPRDLKPAWAGLNGEPSHCFRLQKASAMVQHAFPMCLKFLDWAEGPVRGRPYESRRLDDRVSSVSYTHLRAHETVLDLVCRLLLE